LGGPATGSIAMPVTGSAVKSAPMHSDANGRKKTALASDSPGRRPLAKPVTRHALQATVCVVGAGKGRLPGGRGVQSDFLRWSDGAVLPTGDPPVRQKNLQKVPLALYSKRFNAIKSGVSTQEATEA
jgi:hypothetical protein